MFGNSDIGSPLIYWTLRVLLLVILTYCGWGISKDDSRKFRKYAYFATFAFSLIEGLRWLRGVDYPHYYNDLVTMLGDYPNGFPIVGTTPNPEFLYSVWIHSFYATHLPFWIAFIIYSAMLIGGLLLVLKHFPKIAIWVLPFFFVIISNHAENLIRQFIAVSFFLFAYSFYLKGERKKTLLMLIIAPLFHLGSLVLVFTFILVLILSNFIKLQNKKNVTLVILLSIFFYTYYLWDPSYFQSLSDYISNSNFWGFEKGSTYIDNADRWFTIEGSLSFQKTGKYAQTFNLFYSTLRMLCYLFVILFGFKIMLNDRRIIIPFWFSFICIILQNIAGDIEMFLRISYWFIILYPLMIGFVLESGVAQKWRNPILMIYCLFYLGYGLLGAMFRDAMTGYGFIWDANVSVW